VLAKVEEEHARIKTICICIKFRLKIHSLTDGEIHIYTHTCIHKGPQIVQKLGVILKF
jgi:hypothetical protein